MLLGRGVRVKKRPRSISWETGDVFPMEGYSSIN
jgi:hypothetical protein